MELKLLSFFLDGFHWSGRTGRSRFAIWVGVNIAFVMFAQILVASGSELLRILGLLLVAALVVPAVGYQIRRFHDIGRSGAWVLLCFVPYLGILVVIYLLFEKSADKPWVPVSSLPSRIGYAVCILISAVLVSRVLWAPYWIPSGAMKPNLLVGDYIVVLKQVSRPEYGDVIVFRHPVNSSDFIKRVVGLPGDSVQMRSGQLFINGLPVPQVSDGDFLEVYEPQGPASYRPICIEGAAPLGGICTKEKLIETLPNGVQHSVLNINDGRFDNTGVFTVPDGHYFFMGDNRDNSTDSRVKQALGGVGFVPSENLIGRADRVMFSSAGSSLFSFWTWRRDRFLKPIE